MIWLSIIFLPILIACAFLIPKWRTFLVVLAPWTALPALVMAIFVDPGKSVQIPWLLLGSQFGMDATAKVFLFFTALIWLIAGVYAVFYFSDKNKKIEFFIYYLFAMCGNIGFILAQDVISFYFFFTLMSFSSYGMVVHYGTKPSYDAGKVYICLVIFGEVLIFFSLALAVHTTGNIYLLDLPAKIAISPMRDLIIGLALLGFGVKAGALPFHVWLPVSHPVAPVPAHAILSSAMIKAGLLGWLRILPLGEVALLQWGILVMSAGFLAAFYGVLIGLTQDHIKKVLAYSSISQMGMMTVAVGVGLTAPNLWPLCWAAIMVYATHHALAKGAIFLSIGVIETKITVSWLRYFKILGMLLPALAIMGASFSSGALAKTALKYVMDAAILHHQWPYSLKWLIGMTSVSTTFLMARVLWMAWPKKGNTTENTTVMTGIYLTWTVSIILAALLPIFLQAQNFIKIPGKETFYFLKWSSLWPLIVGGLIIWGALASRWKNPFFIQQGDVLIIYIKVLSLFKSMISAFVRSIPAKKEALKISIAKPCHRVTSRLKHIDHFAQDYATWRMFGAVFLTLFLIFFLLGVV